MTDFERISKIIKNSSTTYSIYSINNLKYIIIYDRNGNQIELDFYRDGKFSGIFIDDEEED